MTLPEDFLVTISDLNNIGACHKGTREWASSVGLEWSRFLESGIKASELLKTGDALAERAVMLLQAQRERQKHG